MRWLSILLTGWLLQGCTGIPKGIEPVSGFNVDRYLGTWYEIARLDHSFERGLDQVTASYSLRDDGGIKVINRGFSIEKNQWQEAEGKACFVSDPDAGHLKVSFFGPFYGSYIIFELDDGYQYAFVTANSREYLWLLSRNPKVSDAVYERFIQLAGELEFDLSGLIKVGQGD